MQGKMVEYKVNGEQHGRGYFSLPEQKRGPGLLMIQEWWGLVPHIQNMADRYARQGFVVLAPDLYDGKTTGEPDEAQKLMMELNIEEAAKTMQAAVSYLRGHDAVEGVKVGALGYCMGGGMTLYLAARGIVDGASPFYGVLPHIELDYSKTVCPILGHYAEHDEATKGLPALKEQLSKSVSRFKFFVYSGTDHAFCNDDRPEIYNDKAAKLAMRRTVEFMKRELS